MKENNKLLAEYLGMNKMKLVGSGENIFSDEWIKNFWYPHKNWNQLMMVVEKIGGWDVLGCWHTDIEPVYNACVKHIKRNKK